MSDQLNSITEHLTDNEGSSHEADLESKKKENESIDLWNLLKKTQSQVSSLENEITEIEAENIHQVKGLIVLFSPSVRIFKILCERQRTWRVAIDQSK